MECLDTTRSLRINLKKNIGMVLIVVEGAVTEFDLFRKIFNQVLGYNYIEKRRTRLGFKEFTEFVMKGNENSRIIVVNYENSNIKNIVEDSEYKNELYKDLYNNYGIDIKNIPVYIVWDRDRGSNSLSITRSLVSTLGNALENENAEMNGLLLLSYPCVEVFIISNFINNVKDLKINNLKQYVKDNGIRIEEMNKETLKKAVALMHKSLRSIGINYYDLDDFSDTGLKILEKEEDIFCREKNYMLLSLLSIIFIDLGIIVVA